MAFGEKEMTEEWLNTVCKFKQGAKTCRYIGLGAEGFMCMKTDASLRAAVDARADKMSAKGDNCFIDPDYLAEKLKIVNT
jgi:hypothetical protein